MGGLSHLDSFDYKPELAKFHGKPFKSEKSPRPFLIVSGHSERMTGPLRGMDSQDFGCRISFPTYLLWLMS